MTVDFRDAQTVRNTVILFGILFISIIVRLIYFEVVVGHDDYVNFRSWDGWGEISRAVADDKGYVSTRLLTYFQTDNEINTAARSPIPILINAGLIKLFGDIDIPIAFFQALLEAATCFGMFYLARFLGLPTWLSLLSTTAYALFPPAIHYSQNMGDSAISILLTLLLFILLMHDNGSGGPRYLMACGVILAILSLSRPTYLVPTALVFAGYAILFLFKRVTLATWLGLFASVTIFCGLLAPWVLRNQTVFERPIVATTLGGYNIYRHNHILEKPDYLEVGFVRFQDSERNVLQLFEDSFQDWRGQSETALDAVLRKEGLRIVFTHFDRFVILSLQRAFNFFFSFGGEIKLLAVAILTPLYLMALAGAVLLYRRYPFPMTLLSLTFIANVAIHAAMSAMFRNMLYFVPVLIVFSAVCLSALVQRYWPNSRFV